MSDLVERLRHPYSRDEFFTLADSLCQAAADRIEALEAELAKVREVALEEAAKAADIALSNTSGFVSDVRKERVTCAIRELKDKGADG